MPLLRITYPGFPPYPASDPLDSTRIKGTKREIHEGEGKKLFIYESSIAAQRRQSPLPQGTDTVVPTPPVEAPAPVSTKSLVQFSLLLLLIIDALLLAANVAHIVGAEGTGRILRIFSPISWNGDYDGSHL